MSLDKFVMRGFTASAGSSMGQWVAKTEQPQSQEYQAQSSESGTSFVLGANPLSQPHSKGNRYSDAFMENGLSADAIGGDSDFEGKRSRRRSRRMDDYDSPPPRLKVWLVLISVLSIAYLVYMKVSLRREHVAPPHADEGADYKIDPNSTYGHRSDPVWYRD